MANEVTSKETGIGATLKQGLHAATGDREAEAEALSLRAEPELQSSAARRAVSKAHGELVEVREGAIAPPSEVFMASPDDVAIAGDEIASDRPTTQKDHGAQVAEEFSVQVPNDDPDEIPPPSLDP